MKITSTEIRKPALFLESKLSALLIKDGPTTAAELHADLLSHFDMMTHNGWPSPEYIAVEADIDKLRHLLADPAAAAAALTA